MARNTFSVDSEDQEIRLYLQASTVDNNGVHYLTAKAITPAEWDYEIDDLVRCLEVARRRGHRLLKRLWGTSPDLTAKISLPGIALMNGDYPGDDHVR